MLSCPLLTLLLLVSTCYKRVPQCTSISLVLVSVITPLTALVVYLCVAGIAGWCKLGHWVCWWLASLRQFWLHKPTCSLCKQGLRIQVALPKTPAQLEKDGGKFFPASAGYKGKFIYQ